MMLPGRQNLRLWEQGSCDLQKVRRLVPSTREARTDDMSCVAEDAGTKKQERNQKPNNPDTKVSES